MFPKIGPERSLKNYLMNFYSEKNNFVHDLWDLGANLVIGIQNIEIFDDMLLK